MGFEVEAKKSEARHMITVTFSELRNNAKKYFDAVEEGETLEIYRNGKPIAVLSPYSTAKGERWSGANPLEVTGISLSKIILEEREEGR
jgi:prevent-host-death family protein